ncbi:hypothetical protein [Brevundimonas naejangsanensis]|uniref:hypothetical protein n=1 Tax=Brevundimonas naejangsanensis TaxID=588932 RepID=UPI0026F19D73|nr:hypothetical protein [Brevundimonas naejangsanensis]
MSVRCVAFVVSGASVLVVDAEVSDDKAEPVVIMADATWTLQKGDASAAYSVMHQRCADYLRENKVDLAVVKASAVGAQGGGLSLLKSAELRGVVISAAASVCDVKQLAKGVVSKTYGSRKVDEYLADDAFWNAQTTGGNLRRMSREAAMYVIAARAG